MYSNLLSDLEKKGLRWSVNGLDSHDWLSSNNNELNHWIVNISEQLVSNYNPNAPETIPEIEPRALILLSQACMLLFQNTDGVFSKDLAMMAYQIEIENGDFDIEMRVLAQGLIASGRYIDCIGYFHTMFEQGIYDESFLPDIIEVLDNLEQWYNTILNPEMQWKNEEHKQRSQLDCLCLMMKIARGAYLQFELGFELMNIEQIKHYVNEIAPRAATIVLHYSEKDLMSSFEYTTFHTFTAYVTYILVALKVVNFSMDNVFESLVKGCRDNFDELTPDEYYFTLFAHTLRLRILSKEQIESQSDNWLDAVDRAEKALEKSSRINAYQIYAQVIEEIKMTKSIQDWKNYADKISRLL